MESKIIIVFRYDDYTARSPLHIEKKIFNIFKKYKKSLTVGVVPSVTAGNFHDCNETEYISFSVEKIQFIKESIKKRIVDISLHGYSHKARSGDGVHSEFEGLPIDEQYSKIESGKKELENLLETNVNTFIPPWNTYDINTIKCLIKNKFKCISANRYGSFVENSNFSYLPITIEFFELEKAIIKTRKEKDKYPIISVLLHPYDFEGSSDKRTKIFWNDFDEKLQWLLEQEDVEVYSVNQVLNNKTIPIDYRRYKSNKPGKYENIYPTFLKATYDEPIYKSQKKASYLKYKKETITIVFYIITGLIIFLGSYYINDNVLTNMKILSDIIKYLSIFLSGLIIIKSIISRSIYFKGFLLFLILISVFIGFLFNGINILQ